LSAAYKTGDPAAIGTDTSNVAKLLQQYLAVSGSTSAPSTPASSPSATPSPTKS
jgi:hypothetical protein